MLYCTWRLSNWTTGLHGHVRGLNQALITVANGNSSNSLTNPNPTSCTYPPPHTFSLKLVSHILPTATPTSPHPPHSCILPNAVHTVFRDCDQPHYSEIRSLQQLSVD